MELVERRHSEQITEKIRKEVAECHGIAPNEIDANLKDRINPDNLSSLCSGLPQENFGVVSFAFYDCRVTVTANGDVEARLHR